VNAEEATTMLLTFRRTFLALVAAVAIVQVARGQEDGELDEPAVAVLCSQPYALCKFLFSPEAVVSIDRKRHVFFLSLTAVCTRRIIE